VKQRIEGTPTRLYRQGEKRMKVAAEERIWEKSKEIFLDGKEGIWPKEVVIKEGREVLRYRLIRTRSGKFQLVK